jgi:hypothetical protein
MTTATRKLIADRAPYATAQGRRIRTLFWSFLAKANGDDPLHVAMALRAAELAVSAEAARSRLLGGDNDAGDDVVRLDNAARRAAQEMGAISSISDDQASVPWTAEE